MVINMHTTQKGSQPFALSSLLSSTQAAVPLWTLTLNKAVSKTRPSTD